MSLQSVMFRRCPFSASYIVSHITCFAWTSGSGTIVPPYLRGQLGGTSPHRRILIQAVNAAHCWLFSHTGRHLGCYCVCLIDLFIYLFMLEGVLAIWAENNVHGAFLAYEWWVTMSLSKTIPQYIMLIKERTQAAEHLTFLTLKKLLF